MTKKIKPRRSARRKRGAVSAHSGRISIHLEPALATTNGIAIVEATPTVPYQAPEGVGSYELGRELDMRRDQLQPELVTLVMAGALARSRRSGRWIYRRVS